MNITTEIRRLSEDIKRADEYVIIHRFAIEWSAIESFAEQRFAAVAYAESKTFGPTVDALNRLELAR